MLVKVKGPAVKLQGVWKYKGETAEIEQEEYERNSKYLDVVSGEVITPQISNPVTDPETDEEEKELTLLREKAKDLGIRGANNMKKETLLVKISEMENADNSGDDDSTDNTDGTDGEETDQTQE